MGLKANMSICIFMFYSMEILFSSCVECNIIIKNDILRINVFQTLKCGKLAWDRHHNEVYVIPEYDNN
jgi:hypothetical protein